MKVLRTAPLAVLMFTGAHAYATSYYIDYSSGVDTNNGTSKTTPLQHAPGMYGCANTCASINPKPGDSVILKGGVTWPTASLGWNWGWSGNATTANPGCTGSGCIYIGVDQTWYSGSSWARPILNGGGVAVNTPSNGVANVLLRLYGSYLVVDNIEFTGLYWSGVPTYGTGTNIQLAGGEPGLDTNVQIQNIYIHGWSHGTSASGTVENPCGITGDTGVPANNNANSILINSAIDGSDTDEASCSAIMGSPPYVENSLIQYVSSAMIVDGPVQISGNSILHVVASFDPTAHRNAIESNANLNVTISNNEIGHLGSGVLGIWCAPNVTYSCTIFNNVLFDTDTGNVLDPSAPVINSGCAHSGGSYCDSAGSWLMYNNTVECGPDSNPNAVCVGIGTALSAVTLQNNQFITNATTPNNGVWSTTGVNAIETTDLKQTQSTATAQGYNMTETYPFSPIAGGSTIGYGTNLTVLCSGGLALLCSDTQLGVAYNTTTHTVSSPGRTTNPRLASWNAGAYQFVNSGPNPNPPSNLSVTVH
jgi:hypothetical protein